MRFQTKLLLAVVLAVALVTIAVILLTEQKMRSAFNTAAQAQVASQVSRVLELRKARLEGTLRVVERLAESDLAVEALTNPEKLKNSGLKDIREFVSSLTRTTPDRRGPDPLGRDSTSRVIFLVDLEGEYHQIGGVQIRNRAQRERAESQVRGVTDFQREQFGHLLVQMEDGARQLMEVVIAPVIDPATGQFVGAVLMGQPAQVSLNEPPRPGAAPATGPGQRTASPSGQRPGDATRLTAGSGPGMMTGVYTAEELFPTNLKDSFVPEVQSFLQQNIAPGALSGGQADELRIALDGKTYRVFYEMVNPGATLPPSYQVVLYPLDQLLADLRDLRIKGSGIGLVGLSLGTLLAWLLARNLGRPIRELARGTEEIRRGNFEARVKVRSRDELGELAESFNQMAGELALKERIRDVLGKVADKAVAQAMIEGKLDLGGEVKKVSILFCDIRGFTGITENLAPAETIALLNEHMTALTEIVYQHHGVVDKFVGDEIMALFGAPKAYGDDALNAARCALRMVEERQRLNRDAGYPVSVGIGIATGEVVVGCMGSVDRLNYTVVGERVNRASRLCGVAEAGEILIDAPTWKEISACAEADELPGVTLRGYSESIVTYRLKEIRPDRVPGELPPKIAEKRA